MRTAAPLRTALRLRAPGRGLRHAPDYLSTAAAEELAAKRRIPLLRVQHHHAHMVSCMADNCLEGECLGLIWDGTGYGTDGATWGGELLAGGARGFERARLDKAHPAPGRGPRGAGDTAHRRGR